MKQNFIRRVTTLLSFKSILMIVLIAVIVALTLQESISARGFLIIYLVEMSLYLTTQSEDEREGLDSV